MAIFVQLKEFECFAFRSPGSRFGGAFAYSERVKFRRGDAAVHDTRFVRATLSFRTALTRAGIQEKDIDLAGKVVKLPRDRSEGVMQVAGKNARSWGGNDQQVLGMVIRTDREEMGSQIRGKFVGHSSKSRFGSGSKRAARLTRVCQPARKEWAMGRRGRRPLKDAKARTT